MSKKYNTLGQLESEKSTCAIPLDYWVSTAVEEHSEPTVMFNFLKNEGKFFPKGLQQYPEKILLPKTTKRGWCHQNNIEWAELLFREQPEVIDDFRFVTGLWQLESTIQNSHLEARYYIGGHSFMIYKGLTLDCTVLNHPPYQAQVYQYFGISFEIPKMLEAFEKARSDRMDFSKVPVVEILRNTPCSKE